MRIVKVYVDINEEVLLIMVTKILPDVPFMAEEIETAAYDLAKMITPEPQHRLIDKILIEMLGYNLVAEIITSILFQKESPQEKGFVMKAKHRAVINYFASSNPNVLKALR